MITQRQVGVSRTVEVPQIQFMAPFEDVPVVPQRRVFTVQAVQGVPHLAGVVAAVRDFLPHILRHFSHSVQGDVECQGGGVARSLTPR